MRALLLCVAFLSGAAGLAEEVLLLNASGVCLGYGSSAALGLCAFLVAWAAGAGVAGRRAPPRRAGWLALGVVQGICAPLALAVLLAIGARAVPYALAASVALLSIGVCGFLQGLVLPWIVALDETHARAPRDVAWIYAANLAGSALGAHVIAGELVGARGRHVAIAAAAGLALLAALGSSFASSGGLARAEARRANEEHGSLSARQAAWIIGLSSAWLAGCEWVGLRNAALWFGGMEPALRASLSASLVALALGALLLPRVLPRDARGVAFALGLAALGLAWPFCAPRFVPRGASGEWETFVGACVLVGPPLLALGALVPLVHRCVAGPRGASLGRLLVHEMWGIGIGLPLAHLVLVPRFGLGGTLAWCALLALACAAVLVPLRHTHIAALGAVLLALPALACAFFAEAPARQSPPYAEPALALLSLRDDRDFAVAVVDDGLRGERTLLTDGFRAAGTGDDYRYMRVLGHLPVLLHPKPERVAVLALGTGTTLGAVALHPQVQHIDVLEISPAVVAAAPFFEATNHGVLARSERDVTGSDARVVVRLGDGRRTLADRPGDYDVVTMEPLLPDAPFGVYLYTREFYAHAARALRPGGILCQWVPPHALEPATFEAVLDAFARAFEWSGLWLAGTQVVLVGSNAEPRLDTSRFEGPDGLRAALREIGLSDVAGVAARYVGPVPRGAADARELRDADPWIVYRPRRRGAVLLGDLPDNLARLRAARTELPRAWQAELDPAGRSLRDGIEALQRARELQARSEARLRGLAGVDDPTAEFARSMERARRLAPSDPERASFERELEFLSTLRRGVSALQTHDETTAVLALERAAELAPGRGDVQLYLAAACERAGEPQAAAHLARALELCPRIALTDAGQRALQLGLSATARAALEASASR